MKTILHKSFSRGHANHGWLNSYHSFSFGSYSNPERIHFGALRVLNDDTVQQGMGFGNHPHNNMEIVSIPLSGDLHHIDSTGRDEIIRQNDVQIMSAGSGIEHSETNANSDKEVKFLQLWVFPKLRDIEPRYQQMTYNPEHRINKLVTVVAPDNDNALFINQDAWFNLGNFSKDFTLSYQLHKKDNGIYAFILKGKITIENEPLDARDGLAIWETEHIQITAKADAEILLIEVPMQIQGV